MTISDCPAQAVHSQQGDTRSHRPHHTPSPTMADPLLSPVQRQCHHLHPHSWRIRSIACFDPNHTWICTRRECKPTFLTPFSVPWMPMRRRSSASVLLKISHSGMQPGVINKNVPDPELLHGTSSHVPRNRAKIHLMGENAKSKLQQLPQNRRIQDLGSVLANSKAYIYWTWL